MKLKNQDQAVMKVALVMQQIKLLCECAVVRDFYSVGILEILIKNDLLEVADFIGGNLDVRDLEVEVDLTSLGG
jgi:hypothetical protein